MPQWISDLIAVAPWLGALFVAGFLIWKTTPHVRKWSRFMDRMLGVPADPKTGQPEILGIFERMDHQDDAIEQIRHEMFPNSGKSLRDQTNRLEEKLTEHLKTCPAPAQTTINVTSVSTQEGEPPHGPTSIR